MHLPVAGTLRILFLNLRSHRTNLVQSLALPAVLISAVDVYLWNSTPPSDLEQLYAWAILLILLNLVASILWALLAVSCHRVLLEDFDKPTMFDGIWIGKRQLKYIYRAVIVAVPLVIWGTSIPIGYYIWNEVTGSDDVPYLVQSAFAWAVLIPAQYLSSRFALTLPAAALQKPLTFAEAWSLSRGNGWRITAVLLAAPAASEVLWLLVEPVLSSESVFGQALWVVISVSVGVIVVGALSYSYKWISNEHRQQTDHERFASNELL